MFDISPCFIDRVFKLTCVFNKFVVSVSLVVTYRIHKQIYNYIIIAR